MSQLTYFNPSSFRLVSDVIIVLLKVCDELLSCSLYQTNINQTNVVKLESINDYLKDIQDPESIPPSIIYYSDITNKTDNLKMIFKNFTNYYQLNSTDTASLQSFISSAKTLIRPNLSPDQVTSLLNLI